MNQEQNLLQDISAIAQRLKDIHNDAVIAYTPLVHDLCAKKATQNEVGWMLDWLLMYAGDERMLKLYKQVCRAYWKIYPETIAFYIMEYRKVSPLVDKTEKCVITAMVRKDDKNFEKYNVGEAKEYIMESIPNVNLTMIKYLMPMPAYNLLGYYEVEGMKYIEKTGGMRFKLGKFFTFGDSPVNVARGMRHGELQNLEYLQRLYNGEKD